MNNYLKIIENKVFWINICQKTNNFRNNNRQRFLADVILRQFSVEIIGVECHLFLSRDTNKTISLGFEAFSAAKKMNSIHFSAMTVKRKMLQKRLAAFAMHRIFYLV